MLNRKGLSNPLETYRKNSCAAQTYFCNSYVSDLRSNNFGIFPVFLNGLNIGLPKCKVAHSIRQSYVYRIADVSKNYPLTYYYLQEGETISFYYNKENLIEYYIQSKHDDNDFCIIPLYNYVKNNYELILSHYGCYFKNHHEVCIVKAPNHMIYLISRENNPIVIAKANKGRLLYNFNYDFGKYASYLFHSMPIANSFVIVLMRRGKKIIIHIIDLIKEKIYVQSYSLEKIMPIILSLLEKMIGTTISLNWMT